MPSGLATTLLFSYPIWTAVLNATFLKEQISRHTKIAIVLAIAGVGMLSVGDNGISANSIKGICLELLAGLTYAIYVVTLPKTRIKDIPSIKANFYIFGWAMIILAAYTLITQGEIDIVSKPQIWVNLFLLALLPTVVSNVTLVMSLKKIDSTHVAILGAFEPLTAMAIGITALGEPMTAMMAIGCALIIISVMLILTQRKHRQQ